MTAPRTGGGGRPKGAASSQKFRRRPPKPAEQARRKAFGKANGAYFHELKLNGRWKDTE